MEQYDDQLHDDQLARAVGALRASVPDVRGLDQRVAARRRRNARRTMVMGSGGITAVAAAVLIAVSGSGNGEQVTFALHAEARESVALVGDFTDWQTDKVKLEPAGNDEWRVTVKLPPGRYRFAYVVDGGEWRADDEAAPVLDDFGRPTSVMTVGTE
jgi:1,4-alpha-glucan branching enzyme